jgi:hypothetical protein
MRHENEVCVDVIYFTIIAVGLYFAADALLDRIERARGARFEQHGLVFFAIILVLSLATFQLMNLLMKPGGG